MGEVGGGEEKEKESFSPSALSLFRFHLSPFPPEMPDSQASGGGRRNSRFRFVRELADVFEKNEKKNKTTSVHRLQTL